LAKQNIIYQNGKGIMVLKTIGYQLLCCKPLNILHYGKKKIVLQLSLQFNFWVVREICKSLYLYVVNTNIQITWVAKLQLTIYTMQLITIQLQLCQNNSFSITIQLHYDCTHDIMLTSLVVNHLLKSNMWQYEEFWT